MSGVLRNVASSLPLLRPVMPELDTARGVAVLGVYLYHALYSPPGLSQWSGFWRLLLTPAWLGHLGVNLFFVLSGFLITRILLSTRSLPKFYSTFYIRRALRILPAYFLLLFVLFLSRSVSYSFILLSLIYLSNFARLFGIAPVYRVLWSLAVEEQFYLLWPWVVRKLNLSALRVCCVGVLVLSPVFRYVTWLLAHKDGLHDFTLNYYTWNSLDGLACGALLVTFLYAADIPRVKFRNACLVLLGVGVLTWILSLPFGILSTTSPIGAAFQVVPWNFAFTALIGFLLLLGTGSLRALVNIRWLQFLGYISYGLYMCHPIFLGLYDRVITSAPRAFSPAVNHPGAFFLRAIIAGAASVLVAYLSRRFFEGRFLRLKDRLT